MSVLLSFKIYQSDKEVNVDWNIYDLSSRTKSWSCPFIDTVKVIKYVLFLDKDCHKKKKPHPDDERVIYNNLTCKRKMFLI